MIRSPRLSVLRTTALWRFLVVGLLGLAFLPSTGRAQLSSPAHSTTGFTCSGGDSSDGDCETGVNFSTPNNGTTFTSRHSWNVNADTGIFSTHDTSSNAQHNVSWTATAPGAYRVDIGTQRTGMIQRNSDFAGCDGQAHTSGIAGSSNFALTTGTITKASPADIGNGGGDNQIPFNQTTAATIVRTSNGVGQNHTLTFTWNGSVRSNSCEAAVRQGAGNGSTTDCGACEYPGSPSRTQANDGHFVSVTFTSLCGNSVIDSSAGEACDQGAANGTMASCCSSSCQFKSSSNLCRNASGALCDVADFCTGSSATCPDNFATSGVCRAAAGLCDVAESCNGSGPNCPADGFASSGVCRAAAGDCDVAESCNGSGASCPADGFAPGGVCRGVNGLCDVAESCTGSSPSCPADGFVTGGVCRGVNGLCDVAESCDGSSANCPTDAFVTGGTCRGVNGVCDVAESCDGSGPGCPTDTFVTGGECRGVNGVCDVAESCDGTGPGCPTDGFASSGECRASNGLCDVAESCDGTGANCPTDGFASGGVCRAAATDCDAAEICDGTGTDCPADAVAPDTTVCRPAIDECDIDDFCDGVSFTCGTDITSGDGDGDGACDQADNCVDDPNTGQGDADSDSIGDACDPCTNTGGSFATAHKLSLAKLLAPIGDDKLTMKGKITIPTSPTINPVANGVRILLENASEEMLDIIIPSGGYNPGTKTGWIVNSAGTRWLYKNATPTPANPIQKITIAKSGSTPGAYKIAVKGKDGDFVTSPGDMPLRTTLVLDTPTAEGGQCGEWVYPTANRCVFKSNLSAVTCK